MAPPSHLHWTDPAEGSLAGPQPAGDAVPRPQPRPAGGHHPGEQVEVPGPGGLHLGEAGGGEPQQDGPDQLQPGQLHHHSHSQSQHPHQAGLLRLLLHQPGRPPGLSPDLQLLLLPAHVAARPAGRPGPRHGRPDGHGGGEAPRGGPQPRHLPPLLQPGRGAGEGGGGERGGEGGLRAVLPPHRPQHPAQCGSGHRGRRLQDLRPGDHGQPGIHSERHHHRGAEHHRQLCPAATAALPCHRPGQRPLSTAGQPLVLSLTRSN